MPSNDLQIVSEPAFFRRSVADMFGGLDLHEQRALIDRLALLPHDIQRLAIDGVIADEIVRGISAPAR